MSEELEAFDRVKNSLAYHKSYTKDVLPTKTKIIDEEDKDDLQIIETALKNYDGLCGEITYLKNKHKKEHKALEIINEKVVDIFYIKMCLNEFYGFEDYNQSRLKKDQLTREEYDLLKEVLL